MGMKILLTDKKITELQDRYDKLYDDGKDKLRFEIMLITLKRIEEQNELLNKIINKT